MVCLTIYLTIVGGMFDYISGANFFGEILEWCGFAVASHSLPALAFAISSCCNLGPRSVHHHRYNIIVISYHDNYTDMKKYKWGYY